MKKINIIGGLPRAGTTLASQILNSNPNFTVTPTSGILDVLKNIRSTFSHNPTWKAQDRLALMPNIRASMKGFLNGFFENENVVFDKNRGWSNNISLLDDILGNNDTKIIWFYRDFVEIIGSIEAQYRKTILLENTDEASMPGAFMSLDRRIATYANEDGLIGHPVSTLRDAIEMGYLSRILFIKYFDLTNNTQFVMNAIHEFIGEEQYQYDLTNIKQTTHENDSAYNYKFLHKIKEGEIKWKKADITLPAKYIQAINERFAPLNKLIFEGNVVDFAGEEFASQPINMVIVPNQIQNVEPENPFKS
jgi:sulfotransferase